jgi:hypothetical protein
LRHVLFSTLTKTKLEFGGVNEYFGDLVAQIDAPVISHVRIFFFNQPMFDISLISPVCQLAVGSFKRAKLLLGDHTANITIYEKGYIHLKRTFYCSTYRATC